MLFYIDRHIVPAAYALLPGRMQSPAATAMLLAIGLQESAFEDRRQIGGGPGRSFWQFEATGVRGVLRHRASAVHAAAVLAKLQYPDHSVLAVQASLEHNDVLACAFARLLLWTLPDQLPPDAHSGDQGWDQYLRAWKPGKPHRPRWNPNYGVAWDMVTP